VEEGRRGVGGGPGRGDSGEIVKGWGRVVVGGGGEGREWGGSSEPDASFGEVGMVRSWLASPKSSMATWYAVFEIISISFHL